MNSISIGPRRRKSNETVAPRSTVLERKTEMNTTRQVKSCKRNPQSVGHERKRRRPLNRLSDALGPCRRVEPGEQRECRHGRHRGYPNSESPISQQSGYFPTFPLIAMAIKIRGKPPRRKQMELPIWRFRVGGISREAVFSCPLCRRLSSFLCAAVLDQGRRV